MKILVIGNGLIGISIIQRLEMEGHELLVFSRSVKRGIQSKQFIGDVFEVNEFAKALSWGPQAIIHTAWVTTHGNYEIASSNYEYSQFTSNLAKSVLDTDVAHLVILGTCAEYGPQTKASTAGITRLNPTSTYAIQKVEAYNSARNSLLNSRTRLTWVRVFQPYGPHQDKNRLLPYLIESVKAGRQIELKDVSSVLDWISTRDIASAISWILNHDTPLEVDLGTSIGYTNLELLQHLESKLGSTSSWTQTASLPDTRKLVTLVGKDSPLFLSGWLPSDTLDSGLEWILGL